MKQSSSSIGGDEGLSLLCSNNGDVDGEYEIITIDSTAATPTISTVLNENNNNHIIHQKDDDDKPVVGMMINNESSSSTESSSFHPISCNKCRTNHKKCDKRLPNCSYCSSRGLSCDYENPRKRGKGSDQYPPEPKKRKIKIHQDWKEIRLLDPNLLVEFYYDVLSNGMAILSKQKFTYFVTNYLNQFLQISESMMLSLETNEYIQSEEELRGLFILYSSLLTVYYQFHAKLELSAQTAMVCEKEISKHSIYCFDNMYFVGGCNSLAFYFMIEGQHRKSKYYSHFVDYYFTKKNNQEEYDSFDKRLYHSYLVLSHVCIQKGPPKDFTSFMSDLPQFFKVLVGRDIEEVVIPEVWQYLRSSEPNSNNFTIFIQLVDTVIAFADEQKRKLMNDQSTITKNFLELDCIIRNIIHDGFRLMFYVKVPELAGDLIEEVALRITLHTENDNFKFVFPVVDVGVRKACEFHLKVCTDIEKGLRDRRSHIKTSSGNSISFDNFALLEKDLKAIKLLSTRFKTIFQNDAQLIEKCEEFLKRQSSEKPPLVCPSIDLLAHSLPSTPQVHIEWNHQNQDSFMSSLMDLISMLTTTQNNTSTTTNNGVESFSNGNSAETTSSHDGIDPWGLFQ